MVGRTWALITNRIGCLLELGEAAMGLGSNLQVRKSGITKDSAYYPFALSDELEPEQLELSVVVPCLNEADSLGHCLATINGALAKLNIEAEVIVADNGSTDSSRQIAEHYGARVVEVSVKGYGSALMGGIEAARGKYIVMGDADASYDFAEIPNFLAKLRQGHSLVQGCRLESGGGTVMPGAMPFLHRWLGNPFFSMLVRCCYRANIHDVNCGLRAFTKELYRKLDQRCTGMEFAMEMVAKTALLNESIAEVPITLHPDRRINGQPHLKTFRDGWRTLRFCLLCSPRWLFLYPGLALILFGLFGYALAMPATVIGGIGLDVHTLLVATCSILIGFQAILFAVSAKTYAVTEGILPNDPKFSRLFQRFTLERGLIVGTLGALVGLLLLAWTVNEWRLVGFQSLDYRHSLRIAIPGVMFLMLGVQTILASFFLSILGMCRN